MNTSQELNNWHILFSTDKLYEAEIIHDRLDDAGFEVEIFSQRDDTISASGFIYVLVKPEDKEEATTLINTPTSIADEELDKLALEGDFDEADNA